MDRKTQKLRAALRVIFELTKAEAIDIHSGDREPGWYITREDILGKGK